MSISLEKVKKVRGVAALRSASGERFGGTPASVGRDECGDRADGGWVGSAVQRSLPPPHAQKGPAIGAGP